MRLEYFASVSVSISPVTVAEYVSTVEYLKNKLEEEFDVVIATVTGEDNEKVRKETCERFSRKYHKLKPRKNDPKILIATDSLSEGVDLPDAETMVNYDLFWTPLKIIQRVDGHFWQHNYISKGIKDYLYSNLVNTNIKFIMRFLANKIIFQSTYVKNIWKKVNVKNKGVYTIYNYSKKIIK